MLASGADVKLGSYEFMVDDTDGPGYLYVPESLYTDAQDIQGSEAKTANPNVLVWTLDDYAGGGEVKYFDERLADSYWYGKSNPRVRGSITSPPTRAQTTVTLTPTSPTEWYTTQVGGTIWVGVGREVFYSTDGATWAEHNSTQLFASGYTINGMTHDGNYPWVSASNGTTRRVLRIDSTTASTVAVSNVTTAIRTYGMAQLEGRVYLWTGGVLLEYNSQATLPITHLNVPSGALSANKVHAPHAAIPAGTFYAGIVSTDTSVIYFTSGGGTTAVYEYKYNAATNVLAGRKIWEPSAGFTARFITHSLGVVYLLGDYGDQTALFGMSLVTREPLFLSYVGQAYSSEVAGTLTPRALAPSYGSQVIMAVDDATTTYYFVYDAETDSLSELDERTIAADGTVYGMATFSKKRLSFANTASTTGRINRWNQDFDTPAGGWGYVSGAHHMRYPYDEKVLFGVQVVQDPSIAAGTVQVEYQIDESGSWVNLGTTSAGVKYTNLPASTGSSTIKFRLLRLRLTGASGARLFNATARAYINAYQEVWRLRLKIDQETLDSWSRPTFRQVKASAVRDYVKTLVTDRNVVTFLDGRRYDEKGGLNVGYTSHTVVVEFPRSTGGIATSRNVDAMQGYADVVLRSITP